MFRIFLPLLAGALTACATAPVDAVRLPMSQTNHCAAPAGVTVKQRALTISLGQRPTSGYAIDVVAQEGSEHSLTLTFRETTPAAGMMVAQVMTSPCLEVMLPQGWQEVTIKRSGTVQQWHFNAAAQAKRMAN